MSNRELVIREIERLPEPLLRELLDFVRFLAMKGAAERFESAIVSESSLGKDWLKPEEEQAWQAL